MKKIPLSIWVIAIGLCSACTKTREPEAWRAVDKIDLKATIFETDSLIVPARIEVSKYHDLFAIINRGGKFVSVYKLSDGTHIKSFAQHGEGPGEFLHVAGVQFLKSDSIAVLGAAQKKFAIYSLDAVLNEPVPMPARTINLAERTIIQPRFLTENLIADTRFNFSPDSVGRLNYFNTEGKTIKIAGDFPKTEREMSPVHLTQSYNSFWDSDETAKRIVLSHTYTDMIEVYDIAGTLIKRMSGPDYFDPNLGERKVGTGTMYVPFKGSKVGYFANRVGPKGILALYSGELYDDFEDRMTELIHFDLNGQPMARYQLDIPIFHFDVDWKNQIVYALSMEVNSEGREFAVIKYNF